MMRIAVKAALVLLLGAGAAGVQSDRGWAQSSPPAEAPTVRANEAQPAQTDAVLITLETDALPITEVLQVLAHRSGLNIVTSPGLAGRLISVRIRNTPFEEALNLVVRAAGLGYERVGNSILVADVPTLTTQTGLDTRVFDLRYADAADVAKQVEVLTREVSATARDNQVIVRGTPAVLEQIASLVEELDRKPGQVLIRARLFEVNASALLEAGIDWSKITKWTTVVAEGNSGASAPGQVPDLLGYLNFDKHADIYRQRAAFQVAIDALMTEGQARLLSNSNLVVVDGESAEIFAGETVPVVITSLQSPGGAGGVLQTVQLEKIDVGVKLSIRPRIAEDGLVTVLAVPEVSRIVAFVGPDNDLPQTATRRARTLVRVHSGEPIYLGGLLTEETRSTVQKVPLLGSIPILGYLFQHHREETDRKDLVIEITPVVVGDSGVQRPMAPNLESQP